jgi:hypothetical protein
VGHDSTPVEAVLSFRSQPLFRKMAQLEGRWQQVFVFFVFHG